MSTLRSVVTNPASSYTAQNAPVVAPEFEANLSVITLESGNEATVSFDGVHDDFVLAANVFSSVTIPARLSKVWVKASAAATVSVWQTNLATAH